MDRRIDTDGGAKLNPALGREWPHYIKRFIQNVSEINRLQGQLHRASFDPADIQDFVDQVKEMTTDTSDMAATDAKGPGWTLFFNPLPDAENVLCALALFVDHPATDLPLAPLP